MLQGPTRSTQVLHLIHDTSVGGVEAAAENLRRTIGSGAPGPTDTDTDTDTDVDYRVAALGASSAHEAVHADVTGRGVNSPRSALRLLREVRRSRPDVLVTSLWRTVALGPLARLLSPRTRWAVWMHLPRYTHRLDRLVHRWGLPRADVVLCDSEATYEALVRPGLARAGAHVPVRLVRPAAIPLPLSTRPVPPGPEEPLRLVFWGRMARQKRLDLAIDLVGALQELRPGGAELLIIGPDSGQQQNLLAHAEQRGLSDRVRIEPPTDTAGIARRAAGSHVFVQLSEAEGFAMSAHEALAAGMVCVLTPVGDLAADCTDGVDSLLHTGDMTVTARRLADLAEDPEGFARMAEAASRTGSDDFVAAFAEACEEIARGDLA